MSIIRLGLVLLFLVFSSYTATAATQCFLLWCYKTKITTYHHPHSHISHTHAQSNHKKYFRQPIDPEDPIKNDKFCQEVQDNFNNLTPKELGTYVEKLTSEQRYEAKKCLE